jgi:hypothetical protein
VTRTRPATVTLVGGSFLIVALLSAAPWMSDGLREHASRSAVSGLAPSLKDLSPRMAIPWQTTGGRSIILLAFPMTGVDPRSDETPPPGLAFFPDLTSFVPKDGNEPPPAAPDDLVRGYVALNRSSVMRVGVPGRVMVRILGGNRLTDRSRADLIDGFPRSDGPRRGPPRVSIVKRLDLSEVMILKLQGDDFTIERQTPDRQAMGHAAVLWLWVVTPRRSGLQALTLCPSVEIRTVEGYAPSTRTCFDHQISVQANPVFSAEHFWTTNMSWLGASLMTAMVASGGSWLRRSRRGKCSPRKEPRHSFKTPPSVVAK